MTFQAAFYKGTRPGLAGIYSHGVRIVDAGPYSHCEAIFSDGIAASASFVDGGVRFKKIDFDESNWDFISLPAHWEARSRKWFEVNEGAPYDLMGNVRFVIPVVRDSRVGRFCSEAFAESIGIPDPWRHGPNGLASIFKYITQPAHAGLIF